MNHPHAPRPHPASEGLFSSASNSSASSIASSASNLTTNSSSAFIKPGEHPKKYEFRLNLIGEKEKLADESPLRLKPDGGGLGATTSSTADLLAEAQQDSGLASDEQEGAGGQASGGSAPNGSRTQQLRKLYCLVVCACLWLHVGRLVVGLLVDKSLVTLDLYSLGAYKIHFLIPAMCLAIQAAAVSTLFIRNNDETSWLVPFYSSKDYLIRSRSNFKPRIEDYTKRVNVSIVLAVFLALVSSISLSAYLVHCVGQSDILITQQQQQQQQAAEAAAAAAAAAASNQAQSTSAYGGATGLTTMSTILSLQRNQLNASSSEMASGSGGSTSLQGESAFSANKLERAALAALLAFDVLWAVYSTYICFLVSFYFNLICSIMKSRFHGISKIIEDLAESNTTKTTNQARKITTLYLEHNEACELLDESNDFWQYLIFFTYFTYIPAYCYCLYNLFFVDFEAWPSFITWVIHTHTGFIILLISFSAAGVSTEVSLQFNATGWLAGIQLAPSTKAPKHQNTKTPKHGGTRRQHWHLAPSAGAALRPLKSKRRRRYAATNQLIEVRRLVRLCFVVGGRRPAVVQFARAPPKPFSRKVPIQRSAGRPISRPAALWRPIRSAPAGHKTTTAAFARPL